MTEHAEDPVGHASAKIVQYVSVATIAAEALKQRGEQRTTAVAAADQKAAAAVRADNTAARNAARLQWQPVLDTRRSGTTSLTEVGLAWAASQKWRTVDAEAALANDRALERMRELRPDVMARFDRLTEEGFGEVEAMQRVAPFFDRPAAREHGGTGAVRQDLTVGQPDANLQTAADVAARAAGEQSAQFIDRTGVVDDARTPHVDERLVADAIAEPHSREAAVQSERAAALQCAADSSADVVLMASGRTPPELAGDGYPEHLTGEVLAAGNVKPRTPDRTAPAAVRSTGLATAARASRISSGGRGR